ncbi:ArnT family glycosyltransferase [Sphingobium sp.]|uniref:ArnT family glycosyltransferase n=1 Tax=Sphingobium sp. TaxID=1912891 RepID=UPI002C96A08C|nr:glycosyltransferase family 39 protein [Sphingobium sp.]HUD91928.1 glycosyltransferase family 39 protein [Sphingobium sp.]
MQATRSPWFWTFTAILAAALYLRLASIHFGLPALNDPDELMFELGAVKMLRGPTLNPGWFGHPATTTMYVLALVDILVFGTGYLAGWWPSVGQFGEVIYADPTWVILPGRIAMTLFAIATIVLAWRLAIRLFDRRAALIAAAILAASPVHITWSQIIRSDMMACVFLLLCLHAALDIAERNRWRDHVLASLWIGAAIATKWPFALSALAVGGATAMLLIERRTTLRQALLRLVAVGAMSLAFLFLISPYLLLDYPTVVRNLTGEGQAQHLGSTGGTAWQNAGWYICGPLSSGLGIVGLALLPVGFIALFRHRRALLLIAPIAVSFFLLLCLQSMVWERWALPLLLLCAIIAGAGVCWLVDRTPPRQRFIALLLSLAVLLPPLLLRTQADARERMNDTRQIAAQWARRHIPAGSTVLVEHFAFDLLPQPWHFIFPIGDAGCIDAVGLLHGKTSYAPIDQARGTRANVDYGTMAPARRANCRPDYAILTQYDRYRREARAFPAEYAAYRELIARGRIVASIAPQRGAVGGRMVTIVAFPKTK